MLSCFHLGFRIWAIWTLLVTVTLFLNPAGYFGGAELVACLGPLVMAVDSRIRREVTFGIGLPVITLLTLFGLAEGSLLRLVMVWLVFAVGVLLMTRMIEGRHELESIAGRVAFAPESEESLDRFKMALEREVGRARRHERNFLVVAIAVDSESLSKDQPEAARSGLFAALAERRAQLEIQDLLSRELHVYTDVARSRDNVLALVPEADPIDTDPLIARLRKSIREELGFEIQVGRASFPNDAISGEDLVSLAEHARKVSNLRSIRDHAEPEPAVSHFGNESQA